MIVFIDRDPYACPNCGAQLVWLTQDGTGVSECRVCVRFGAHDGPCRHAEPCLDAWSRADGFRMRCDLPFGHAEVHQTGRYYWSSDDDVPLAKAAPYVRPPLGKGW